MFEKVAELLAPDKKIIILPHKNADGDCLGSAFALKLALLSLGHTAEVVLREESDLLDIVHKGENFDFEPDVVVAVDCADEERMGDRIEIFKACEKTVNIDHHKTNTNYADVNIVDAYASATGEMIFKLCRELGVELSAEIADNIYLAILTDTGRFTHNNTTPETHKIVSELVALGANFNKITKSVYENKPYSKLLLQAKAIMSIKRYNDGKIATVKITKADIEDAGASMDDASGLVDIAVSLSGVETSVYLKETDDGIKASMRSSVLDVSKIALIFGGGGHPAASGCTLKCGIDEAEAKLLDIILGEI